MDNGGVLKFALIGVAGYLGYSYLKSSGLWAQWFGGNSFTDTASLLSYCASNPSGSASYGGQTAACSAWLSAAAQAQAPAAPASPVQTPPVNPSPGSTSTTTVASPSSTLTPVSTPAPAGQHVTPLTAAQLTAAVQKDGYDPTQMYSVDQWNYFVANFIDSQAVVTDLTQYGYTRGTPISAAQYISLRQQAGLSGLGNLARSVYRNPYRWVH